MKRLPPLLALVFLVICITAQAQEIKVWKLADIKTAIAQANKPTILNFWATFCKPCLKEIPYFQEVVKKYQKEGVQLILISVDAKEAYPQQIQALAKRLNFTAPIVFLHESNADLFCPAVDPKWSGAIPASLFINNKKGYRHFVEDNISKDAFEAAVKAML